MGISGFFSNHVDETSQQRQNINNVIMTSNKEINIIEFRLSCGAAVLREGF
jgi:hypothetical protein